MTARVSAHRSARLFPALLLALAVASPSAQTKITPEKNSYSVADDVKVGQEAAAEAKKQLPMLNDDRVDTFVENVGARLAAAIAGDLRHAGFRYTFDVVNQKEINAFALPGGPMFLNRGMIEAAKTEAEVAGVMAHEIAHVALRHGTAQATKGQKFQIGAVAGQILGAIVGGTAGSVISQGSQFGLGTYFLKYGREYERQADLMGAQIMARAGYDPREMANMFKTIQAEGGGGGPEWLSSHPDPGNRYDAIVQEASMLRVVGKGDSGQFESIKSRLAGMPPAYTAEQIAKGQTTTGPRTVATGGRRVVNVEPPSNSYRTYQPSDFLRISVPANWDAVDASAGSVTYAPKGGFIQGDNAPRSRTACRWAWRRAAAATCSRTRSSCSRTSRGRIRTYAPRGTPDARVSAGAKAHDAAEQRLASDRQPRIRHAVDDAAARREPAQHHWPSRRSLKRRPTRTHSDAFGSTLQSGLIASSIHSFNKTNNWADPPP